QGTDRPGRPGTDEPGRRTCRRRDQRPARLDRSAGTNRRGPLSRRHARGACPAHRPQRATGDRLSRIGPAVLVAVALAVLPLDVSAQDPGAAPNAHHEAARIISAELTLHDAASRLQTLAGEKPVGLAETMRHELAVAS